MSLISGVSRQGKAAVRSNAWEELRKVALPDSRFHLDFSSFIPDFAGSRTAVERLLAHPACRACSTIFITPDNCLEHLRERCLDAGVKILTTTYGIRRGFWLLDPAAIGDPTLHRFAATLDGMERVGRPVSLRDIAAGSSTPLAIDLVVTGTGVVDARGVRLGKGHGYFDLEWGMLFAAGVVGPSTLTATVVHDCQVLDAELVPDEFDTVCDLIVTPTRVLRAEGATKPTGGILWERLEPGLLEEIPPLRELHAPDWGDKAAGGSLVALRSRVLS